MAKTPATTYFGSELRRAREAAGLSREEFGKLVSYAPSTIGAFETGDRFPPPGLATGADELLKTGGQFGRMLDKLLTRFSYPESFRPWVDYEEQATALRTYEVSLVPGLLQIEEYARALLASHGDNTESKLAARLQRQEILTRPRPPKLVALIDETALRQPIGGPGVMRRQLTALAAEAPWIIQVVPLTAQTYIRFDGAFTIATVDGRDVVYLPAQLQDYTVDSPELVAEARWRWDAIRAEALPRRQSRELILELAHGYERSGGDE